MAEASTRLSLPYIMPRQAQKQVTPNEALKALDVLVDAAAAGGGTDTPPASPAEGECHVVGAAPTGGFAGQAEALAAFVDGAWVFQPPFAGLRVWDIANGRLMVYYAGAWADIMSLGSATVLGLLGSAGATMVGVNAAADATNRLTVKSDAVLLSHDDVTPGTGDMRAVLNKAGVGDTASLLFQTGYSGRAEFGLAGSDGFSVKVSPDGSTWHPSFSLDPTDGGLTLDAGLDGNGQSAKNLSGLVVGGTASLQPTTLYGNALVKDGNFYVQRDTWGSINFQTGSDTAAGTMAFYRARGSMAAPTETKANDIIGQFAFWGYDGSAYQQLGQLIGYAGADLGTSLSSFARLYLQNAGASQLAQYWGANGNVGIGTSAPSTKLHVDGPVRTKSYTVATLPGAASAGAGARALVTDATATSFATTVAGGGATVVPVYSDGTNWKIG
jgi:hypothetical protein